MEINKHEIKKLIRRDATEKLPDGNLGLRIVAQYRGAPTSRDRKAWTARLEEWQKLLSENVAEFGAKAVDGTLSVSGQSVELIVPITDIERAVKKLTDDGVKVKLQHERTIDPDY